MFWRQRDRLHPVIRIALGRTWKKRAIAVLAPALAIPLILDTPAAARGQPSQAAAQARTATKMVALGDSITYGLFLSANLKLPSPLAYPSLIAQDEGWQLQNLAIPGWTSQDLLQALQTTRFQTALRGAAVVTIDIGSNDLLHAAAPMLARAQKQGRLDVTADDEARLLTAIAQFSTNLPAIIRAVRAQTSAPIVLLALYDPFPDGHPLHALGERMLALANQIIVQTAAQTGSLFADVYLPFNHHQAAYVRVAEQDVHPTALGQRVLADTVETVLAHPLSNQPHAYAIAPRGAIIRSQPSPAAPALYWLHGNEAAVVTGATTGTGPLQAGTGLPPSGGDTAQSAAGAARSSGAAPAAQSAASATKAEQARSTVNAPASAPWLQVVTPDGRTGYVAAGDVNLLLRPWNQVTFQSHPGALPAAPLSLWRSGKQAKETNWPAVLVNGAWFAPVSVLARLAGGHAVWDNAQRQVSVTTPGAAGVWGTLPGVNQALAFVPVAALAEAGEKHAQGALYTEGIEITVDGEPLQLGLEPFIWHNQVYVPMRDFWQALGGRVTPVPHGLRLLSPSGS